jgi:hypothetical protein
MRVPGLIVLPGARLALARLRSVTLIPARLAITVRVSPGLLTYERRPEACCAFVWLRFDGFDKDTLLT